VSDAPSITDTLIYPILTSETSPHFAEVLPVTVFGAMKSVIGSEGVRQAFRWLATRFSNCTDYRFELVAAGASGNLAYTLGYEHVSFSMDGGPVAPLTLRHHVYRREDGEWKIVHRHADSPRSTRPLPPTHRRSKRHRRQSGCGRRAIRHMTASVSHGQPVSLPHGFAVTCEAGNAFRAAGRRLPDSMLEEVAADLCGLGKVG
jgi:ketosteroid isomerase-like protein